MYIVTFDTPGIAEDKSYCEIGYNFFIHKVAYISKHSWHY